MFRYGLDPTVVGTVIDSNKVTIATAGVELPIVPIAYSTGTITLVSGSRSVVGVGTTFVGNVVAGYKIETAGGNIYAVESVVNNTNLKLVVPASASESGVTYKAYNAFETQRVIIKADDGNANNIYVGQIGLTNSTGLELDAGNSVELLINNRDANLYLDAGANSQVAWILFERSGGMQNYIPVNITYGQSKRSGGTAGTKQILTTKVDSIAILISALSTNSSSVYIGDSTVSATTGFELVPGEIMPFPIFLNDKSADLYIYADNNEGVSWIMTTY